MKILGWLALATLLIAPVAKAAQKPDTSKFKPGQKAPSFVATDLNGRRVSLADYRGKVVLLDFWATWCIECQDELPELKKIYQQYHGKGFEVLGVSWDDAPLNANLPTPGRRRKPTPADVRRSLQTFMRNNGMTWPQVLEMDKWNGRLSSSYGVRALPAVYLIDGSSRVILAKNFRGPKLAQAVATALAHRH